MGKEQNRERQQELLATAARARAETAVRRAERHALDVLHQWSAGLVSSGALHIAERELQAAVDVWAELPKPDAVPEAPRVDPYGR